MKIEIYVKNRDLETVQKHLKMFKTSIKKGSKYDIYNQSLSNADYRQILKLYIDCTSIIATLKIILELFEKNIDIRIAFKYSNHGNLILINQNEINSFINYEELTLAIAVNNLYQSGK